MLRFMPAFGASRARLALLLLAPWMLIAALGGGLHSHSLGIAASAPAAGVDAAAASVPIEAPQLDRDRTPRPDSGCTACLWQLHSSASLPAPATAAAALPATPRSLACCAPLAAADGRSFDPRGPPRP